MLLVLTRLKIDFPPSSSCHISLIFAYLCTLTLKTNGMKAECMYVVGG